MIKGLIAAMLLAPLPALAHSIDASSTMKGTALSATGPEDAAILVPVNAIFAALNARDGAAVLEQVHGPGGITVVVERPDGARTLRQQNWTEWAQAFKPGPEKLEEWFVTPPSIKVDGDIAMVWGDYVFMIDDQLSHCGINHFGLVRVEGRWKIASLAWTQRKTGCPTQ